MLNGLTLIATLGSLFLFLCALSDAIEFENQKTEARRELFRKAAFAEKQKERTKKENRENLWRNFT